MADKITICSFKAYDFYTVYMYYFNNSAPFKLSCGLYRQHQIIG